MEGAQPHEIADHSSNEAKGDEDMMAHPKCNITHVNTEIGAPVVDTKECNIEDEMHVGEKK